MDAFLRDDLTLDEMLALDPAVIDELLQENERLKKERENVRYEAFKKLSHTPQIVIDCIGYLRANQSVMQEGLFRIPGTNAVVEQIREAYTKQEYEDVLSVIPDVDANVVATTLKGYFRLLDDPIIPNDLYEEFMDIQDSGHSQSQKNQLIAEKIRTLQSPNKEVLCYLMIFFKEVVAQQEINHMLPQTLATCIAPSMMRFNVDGKKETGKMMALMELGLSIKILSAMLTEGVIDFEGIIGDATYKRMEDATKYVLRGAPAAPPRNRHNDIKKTSQSAPPPPGLGPNTNIISVTKNDLMGGPPQPPPR